MRKGFLLIPQELNDYVGTRTGTDTTALRPVPNPSNSSPTSGTPYYEYIYTWVDYLLSDSYATTAIMREIGYVYKLIAIYGSK